METLKTHLIKGVLLSLVDLYNNGISHRDLKEENYVI